MAESDALRERVWLINEAQSITDAHLEETNRLLGEILTALRVPQPAEEVQVEIDGEGNVVPKSQ